MEKWLKTYRIGKKKSEEQILMAIDKKKIEIYKITQINRIESEISGLEEKIKVLKLHLEAFKRE